MSSASELRQQVHALDVLSAEIGTVEAAQAAHQTQDTDRFLQVHQGVASLEHRLEFVEMRLELMHDQMIEGFRKLGAQMDRRDPDETTPRPRRGKNGR